MRSNTSSFTACALCLSLGGATTIAVADIINVPDDYPTIQQGIDAAVDGDQVWVADGAYTGEGNRDIDFQGKAIIVRSQSGDPNACIIDCEGDEDDPHRGFIFESGEGKDSRLEGFTISSGWAEEYGGAVYILTSSPTITGCVFSPADGGVNRVGQDGYGGAVSSVDGSALFIDCVFAANFANDSAGHGGAMSIQGGAVQLINCTFSNNQSGHFFGGVGLGGAVYIAHASATLSDCLFTSNLGGGADGTHGGAIYCIDSALNLVNCSFENNALETFYDATGAAVHIVDSVTEWVNCSFSDNLAYSDMDSRGGAVYREGGRGVFVNCLFQNNCADGLNGILTSGGGLYSSGGDLVLINCAFIENSVLGGDNPRGGGVYGTALVANSIVWGNLPEASQLFGTPTVSYSDVQGGWPGEGNINADPLFVDPDNGDYRLLSGSPCIDAGDNTAVPKDVQTDLDRNPRFVDDPATKDTGNGVAPIVDMGAYEFQVVSCVWDLDGDEVVGTADLILLLGAWGDPYGTADLIELLGAWGSCPK